MVVEYASSGNQGVPEEVPSQEFDTARAIQAERSVIMLQGKPADAEMDGRRTRYEPCPVY